MSTAAPAPWTSDAFAPNRQPDRELKPYRVKIGDDLYDERPFTSDTSHRYQVYVSGIGAGKTVAGIMRMAAHVNEWNPGELGMVVAPTSLGIKNNILPELAKWGFLDEWDYHGPQSREPGLHAPNGTRILLESAENERKIQRLRGPSIAWFWIDEARLVPEKTWRILLGRLRTGEYLNGFITSTPRGYNWLYEKFHPESDDRIDDLLTVMGIPSHANPHTSVEYRRDVLGDYEGQFRQQEVLGEFVKFAGLVYPWFDRDGQVVGGIESNIRQVFYGVDWGFEPHPACILALAETTEGFSVLECHYEKRNTVKDLAAKADRMQQRHGIGPFFCDPSEPSNIETFRRQGLDARKADNSVTPGIQHVTSVGEHLKVVDTCQPVIDEFNQYQWEEDGEEPDKTNDHAMDALRYGLFTYDQEGALNIGTAFG